MQTTSEEWMREGRKPEDWHRLLQQITKAVVECALQCEMDEHLGYLRHDPAGYNSGNSRNGFLRKRVRGEFGEVEIQTPRDRNGTFVPRMLRKNQRHWTGFDDRMLALYARGTGPEETARHLAALYPEPVSPRLLFEIAQRVRARAEIWQNRKLAIRYGVVFLSARGDTESAVYTATGVRLGGRREVLGLWVPSPQAPQFWAGVLEEWRVRGVREVYRICVEGLQGYPLALAPVFA